MNDNKQADIESTLAHHERQIEDLSDIVSRQADEIALLKRAILHFKDQLEDTLDTTGEDKTLSVTEIAARDKPPHY